ncbi:juvenile hormone-binding protein-like [Achroia grisella]|uniref:juvenile hormone-binding protein-like n=1 Tax=Achroia grisella TaxID=688607 RepID=UPI0027D24D98|nr:juvenile hormone-binding protein-like [Achroia grisella]
MFSVSTVLVLLVSQQALSQIIKVDPCSVNDADCLIKSQTKFLREASRGTPDSTLKSTDPFLIPHYSHTFEKEKLLVELKNVVVTGFKNQEITNSKFTPKDGAIDADVDHKLSVIMTGDMLLKSLESGKQLSGPITIESSLNEKLKYVLTPTVTADKKFKGLMIGPEEKQCSVVGEPKLTTTAAFKDGLVKEIPKKLEEYDDVLSQLKKTAVCLASDAMYAAHLENLRISAADYGLYNTA